jgi:hypothetical protein
MSFKRFAWRLDQSLTATVLIDIRHNMITCRYQHAKAKKSPIKGTEDLRTR